MYICACVRMPAFVRVRLLACVCLSVCVCVSVSEFTSSIYEMHIRMITCNLVNGANRAMT